MANPLAIRRRMPACAVVAPAIDTGLKHGSVGPATKFAIALIMSTF